MREEIIRMAQEAGLGQLLTGDGLPTMWHGRDLAQLERFAALVAVAKKEECAKECDMKAELVVASNTTRGKVNSSASFAAGLIEDCAAAIRALP